jgi:hypothetical protein
MLFGDPQRFQAVLEVLGVPLAVILERLAVLVVIPAVQLHDQLVLWKVGVDLQAVAWTLRPRQLHRHPGP